MVGRTALITGATAGIGAAFARRLAADGLALVLVARDEARLSTLARELRSRHGVDVEVLAADLADDAGCASVEARVADQRNPIDVLVNNAGLGLRGSVLRNPVEQEEHLLRLNVRAVLRLAHAALPGMTERGAGAIINVASVAAFTPMTGSTYPASKAWVVNFSESIDLLVRPRGVRVLALCPGLVRTEFHERAGITTDAMPQRLWLDAGWLVDRALRDLERGRRVSIPSLRYRALVSFLRYAPRRLVYRMSSSARKRTRRED
ncbi:SDR family oxidoreductase [Pilimelia columellifera]|uniref:SDR family oxidoreductase n=1 Tax=Pilimelia columellifera subsp. columellifera TaxID=706583 RepID=A0ABN3N283_9ACTN